MKMYEVIFKYTQEGQGGQLVAAESPEHAKSGVTEMLKDRVPGFEIISITDVTKPLENPEEQPKVVAN